MSNIKTCLSVLLLFTFVEFYQCTAYGRVQPGRNGGFSKSGTASYRRSPGTTSRSRTTARPRTTDRWSSSTPSSYQRSTTSYYRTTARYPTVGSTPGTTPRWNLPPRPGSGGYQGPEKVVYVNKYNYHYPGYYSLPVQQQSHPGYYYTPTYHYSSHDTGSTALGFFLGYSLGKLTTPTYSHYSFYDGYRPRYDHYTVHHYYHDKDAVPENQNIQANTIVGCVGDSTNVCPVNTTSLCTSNGALMCVVSATSTVPCTENRQVNCVKSTISCVNNTAEECKNSNSTSINIPCISTAKVYGDVKYVNNTITSNATNSTNTTSTPYPITTTPSSETTTSGNARKRRETSQDFCVTIVALPAEKKLTEGEKTYESAKNLVSQFIENAWAL